VQEASARAAIPPRSGCGNRLRPRWRSGQPSRGRPATWHSRPRRAGRALLRVSTSPGSIAWGMGANGSGAQQPDGKPRPVPVLRRLIEAQVAIPPEPVSRRRQRWFSPTLALLSANPGDNAEVAGNRQELAPATPAHGCWQRSHHRPWWCRQQGMGSVSTVHSEKWTPARRHPAGNERARAGEAVQGMRMGELRGAGPWRQARDERSVLTVRHAHGGATPADRDRSRTGHGRATDGRREAGRDAGAAATTAGPAWNHEPGRGARWGRERRWRKPRGTGASRYLGPDRLDTQATAMAGATYVQQERGAAARDEKSARRVDPDGRRSS